MSKEDDLNRELSYGDIIEDNNYEIDLQDLDLNIIKKSDYEF